MNVFRAFNKPIAGQPLSLSRLTPIQFSSFQYKTPKNIGKNLDKMGINSLLKFMKPYVQSVQIKKYAGKRVGIDAYSWLHKGAYSCSMELCLDMEGDKKFRYLNYFMHRINMLMHYKINPVVVFDGGNIPCKATTEDDRHRRRKFNHDKAMEMLKEGDSNAASDLFQRAISITPVMAHELIQVLRSENIEFVVAPYEADAQLAYLSGIEPEKGGIAAVISEDSDLLAYGCPAVIFKMDQYGNGEEILLDKVLNTVDSSPSFKNFDKELFTGMCVLAGCDFLRSVPGIGISKSYNLVSKYRNLARVLSVLKFEKGKQMPEDYPTAFRKAVAVFQHARVYDGVLMEIKPLKPLSAELLESRDEELDFLGPYLSPSVAVAIAEGNLDPCSMKAFDHFPQSKYNPRAIQESTYRVSRQESTTQSSQGSCFTAVSHIKIPKKMIRGDDSENAKHKDLIGRKRTEEVLHSEEALTLRKLVFPSSRVQAPRTPIEIPPNIPNNNPFKKQKTDELKLNQEDTISVAVSEELPSEIKDTEIFPVSKKCVDSGPVKSSFRNSKKKK